MIPDATAIAQGGTIVSSGLTAYPILTVILAFIVVLGFGVTLINYLRKAVPKGR